MNRRKMFGYALLSTALGIALSIPSAAPAQHKDGTPLKLGMVKAFFNDLPEVIIAVATQPFSELMKQTTGLDGKLSYDQDAFGTAAQLNANQLQLGVFNGHEFAWAQQKYPDLRPLMIVTNKQHDVRAYVIVHKNSPAKSIADLRGKKIDFPLQTKEHGRVFVNRYATDNAQSDPRAFFGAMLKTDSAIDGLNDVCQGKADAVVVDGIALEFYKDIKLPVYEKNLRILQKSDAFPSAVIGYKQGAVSPSTLKQFSDGLCNAHKNAVGSDLMKMWNIDRFEVAPANYAQTLAECLKTYPAPAEAIKVGMR